LEVMAMSITKDIWSSLLRRERRSFLFVFLPLILVSFALSPTARAQLSPAPDGGYPNHNTAEGDGALQNVTTGTDDTAVGFQALSRNTASIANTALGSLALNSNTTGEANTACGAAALSSNTTGNVNTATGDQALRFNTSGTGNTATGQDALNGNTTGAENTATGLQALFSNTTGSWNTATGVDALTYNTTGGSNTASGGAALNRNTIGQFNTATGFEALFFNTIGQANTATGMNALENNTTGNNNIADGFEALVNNTSGGFGTAVGTKALFANTTGINNTACGSAALGSNTTGSGNIAIGRQAGVNLTTGSNNIDIGNVGLAGESNTVHIGKQGTQKATFIAGVFGTAVSGSTVVVNSTGKLGVATSSARFKQNIKPMNKASEAILAFKPVTFRYKEELDPDGIPQFGLVAEEVEKINPNLVVRGEDGKVMTVRYEAVNAMLLNEFLKEHGQVQQLKTTVAQQQKQIEALAATIQKVSDQVALSKPAPKLVTNR
jgi:hypothetical protein